MARKRMIDASFWDDEDIGALSWGERILFVGLICNADDEGIVKANPRYLKSEIFRYDNVSDAEVLEMRTNITEKFRSVVLYEEDGHEYIKLESFLKHQTLKRPTPSKHPMFRKKAIPSAVRRELAKRYGQDGIGEKEVPCHWCGESGKICWMSPSWVYFSGLEIDHIIPESKGGTNTAENLVLSCRLCNRSKKDDLEPPTRSAPGQHQVSTRSAPGQHPEVELEREVEGKKKLTTRLSPVPQSMSDAPGDGKAEALEAGEKRVEDVYLQSLSSEEQSDIFDAQDAWDATLGAENRPCASKLNEMLRHLREVNGYQGDTLKAKFTACLDDANKHNPKDHVAWIVSALKNGRYPPC